MATYSSVLDFWFKETAPKQWFVKSDVFDATVRERLFPLYARARDGELESWRLAPQSAVALCILLDQVPRNVFRQDPRTFATDPNALRVAKAAVAEGFDQDLTDDEKLFLYLPFEHSEDLADQLRSVELFTPIGGTYYEYALKHLAVIKQFGRFPHRNAVLGRTSTTEEQTYLAQPGAGF